MKQKEKLKNNTTKRKGFTLIEMLVVLFIFSLMTVTFYRVFSSGTILMFDAKKRIAAAHVANEKIEIMRSLSYGDIGTTSGTPNGVINPDEYLTSGTYQFHVVTSVVYVDDDEDGLAPADTDPTDYKRATINVSWGGESSGQKVTLYSDFVPFGTEEGVAGTGTLSIRVIDAEGAAVDSATVNIVNNDVSPAINMTESTDSNGYIIIPGAPASDQQYILSVSKSGYDSVATLSPYPTSLYYPTDTHASSIEDDISEAVISIGEQSNLQIQFWDAYGTPVGSDIDFDMEGGRNMGVRTDSSIVYNYDESLVYSGGSSKKIEDISPGSYKITVTEPGYKIWRVAAGTGNEPDEIILPQGEYLLEKGIKILNESNPSYFVRVLDADTGFPLDAASVTLTNAGESFDETVSTDDYGYAYFPDSPSGTLINGSTYDVSITISGYDNETTTTTISNLTEDIVNLTPQ